MDQVRLRASPEQFGVLIEFMERHGDLSRPQAGSQGRLRGDRLWGELTTLLNSIGGGVENTQAKWKKVWADWKTKTKNKCMLIRRHASGTGGGPSNRQTLTALEERVFTIIGVSAVVGQAGIQEQGLNTLSQPCEVPITGSERREFDFELPVINIGPPPPEPPASPSLTTTSLPLLPTPRSPQHVPQTPPRSTDRLRPSPFVSPQTIAGSPRRRLLRARRNRGLTPFDRAVGEFVAVEQGRLRLEETRNRQKHEREMEQLRLEAQRIDATREQNQLLRQLAELLQHQQLSLILSDNC